MAKRPYYITTAIAYASGKPHIGNTYEIVLADSIARYKRFTGFDVRFMTGTDEHGQKIETKAFENLSTPKEYVDEKMSSEKLLNVLLTCKRPLFYGPYIQVEVARLQNDKVKAIS
jgi:methionyl-tRNA synthetase